jgi:hypothetical protein
MHFHYVFINPRLMVSLKNVDINHYGVREMHVNDTNCNEPDPLESARREVEIAEAEEVTAIEEVKHAAVDLEKAEHHREEAEAALEEAEHHRSVIHIKVDGEDFETTRREMTPDEIIREFGGQDPTTHYLREIEPHGAVSFQGKGGIPIFLHECAQFYIASVGPATVSDINRPVGAAAFISELMVLEFEPKTIPDKPDHVFFDYCVPAGSHTGKTVRIGLVVPGDFPMSPPSGPFVSPRIHPFSTQPATHPTGGVHRWTHFDDAGGEWQYWSRPFPNWPASKRTVAAYMAHILNLWATQ